MKKANDYEYEIDTAGLDGQMYFCGGSSCGHIKNGVALRLSIVRGGWVVPLSHIWQMAFIATMQAAEQSVQRTALPCGHDVNNLRMGVNGYGCAECESSRR